jgi:peptidoglycan/xylan/chitin deacetylase (PgdA/CDA1 family)
MALLCHDYRLYSKDHLKQKVGCEIIPSSPHAPAPKDLFTKMIYVSHGIIPSYSSERISHALCLPESRVALHLQLRRKKYVPLGLAIAGRGDALTVDDATYAGLELALMARHYGHAVSWFVNGSHIENRIEYFPFQISCMLDDTRSTECQFDGQMWSLKTMAEKRSLRAHLKHQYMRMRSQDEITELIDRLAESLHSNSKLPERSLRTVGAAELAQAVLAGVDLQNHGWGHLNPQVLSEEERATEVVRNDQYLSQFRRTITCVFAPPFGQCVTRAAAGHVTLLANRSLMPSFKDANVINRGDLILTASFRNRRERASRAEKLRLAA